MAFCCLPGLLAQLMLTIAHRKDGSEIVDIALNEVPMGDLLGIKPGKEIPSDGAVDSGES